MPQAQPRHAEWTIDRIGWKAAAVVAPLAQQMGDALERRGEGGSHRLGGAGDLAGLVAALTAEPGAHAADLALGLAVAVEDLDAAMQQLAVCRGWSAHNVGAGHCPVWISGPEAQVCAASACPLSCAASKPRDLVMHHAALRLGPLADKSR